MCMVRFFEKLKGSLRKKTPSTRPMDPQTTPQPPPEARAAIASDQPGTALATASPVRVADAAPSHRTAETVPEPSSSSVVRTRASSVKLSRVRVRRVMRPRPVIRESQGIAREDPASVEANPESVPSHKPLEDSEQTIASPEPVTPKEHLEQSASSPEPATAYEDPEKPASSAGHVIKRKPMARKRLRKIRVVKPKVRVAH